jgi:hypothetical protein
MTPDRHRRQGRGAGAQELHPAGNMDCRRRGGLAMAEFCQTVDLPPLPKNPTPFAEEQFARIPEPRKGEPLVVASDSKHSQVEDRYDAPGHERYLNHRSP